MLLPADFSCGSKILRSSANAGVIGSPDASNVAFVPLDPD